MMRRRDFLTSLTAALAILTSSGSNAAIVDSGKGDRGRARLPKVALVAREGTTADMTLEGDALWKAVLQELRRLGYVEGETITIRRWSGASRRRHGYRMFFRRVVDSKPDVIIARGERATRSLQIRTEKIPIINVGRFPAEWHFVESLQSPGGNITGISDAPPEEMFVKQVELLHDALPEISRVAWLGPKRHWDHPLGQATLSAAKKSGFILVPMLIEYPIEEASIQRAFQGWKDAKIEALFVASSVDMFRYRNTVVELATEAELPAISLQREYAELGLLMSYLTDEAARYGKAAHYVDQILRGGSPADLPVQVPILFDLVINLKTAQALGITMPPSIMMQATEIIE